MKRTSVLKSIGKQLVKPWAWTGAGLLYLAVIVGGEQYLAHKGDEIHRKHKVPVFSEEEIEINFRQEQKKIGLQDHSIELILKGREDEGGILGTTKKTRTGYQVTLFQPYTIITARHELSHVDDLVHGRTKFPRSRLSIFPLISEWRAQNYSIAEVETYIHK